MNAILHVALVAFATSASLSAQGRSLRADADSSAAGIMARVGKQPGAVWLRNILRKSGGVRYPQSTLDGIGDSLVARAIAPASADQRGEAYTGAVNAVLALWFAGSGREDQGTPYAGAFDRLIAVHRKAPSPRVRARAIVAMLSLPSHGRAVDYLRGIAESGDASAYDVILSLIQDSDGASWAGVASTQPRRDETAQALRSLSTNGRVKDAKAARLLEEWVNRR